jgi:hypothetical protein
VLCPLSYGGELGVSLSLEKAYGVWVGSALVLGGAGGTQFNSEGACCQAGWLDVQLVNTNGFNWGGLVEFCPRVSTMERGVVVNATCHFAAKSYDTGPEHDALS